MIAEVQAQSRAQEIWMSQKVTLLPKVTVYRKSKHRLTFPADQLLSIADLARVCAVTHEAVRYWVRRRFVPPFDLSEGLMARRWLGSTLNAWRSPLADKYLR